MIDARIPGIRHDGFQGMNTAVEKGTFMYNAGEFAAAHIPVATTNYASLGDGPRMLTANQYTHSGNGVFPVNKLIFVTHGADQDNDTIASGRRLIFYEGGTYATDQYDVTASSTNRVVGDALYVNSTGYLMNADGADYDANYALPPVAYITKVSALPATANWNNGGTAGALRATLEYRLTPAHAYAAPHVGAT